jgi:hypothetical protein
VDLMSARPPKPCSPSIWRFSPNAQQVLNPEAGPIWQSSWFGGANSSLARSSLEAVEAVCGFRTAKANQSVCAMRSDCLRRLATANPIIGLGGRDIPAGHSSTLLTAPVERDHNACAADQRENRKSIDP